MIWRDKKVEDGSLSTESSEKEVDQQEEHKCFGVAFQNNEQSENESVEELGESLPKMNLDSDKESKYLSSDDILETLESLSIATSNETQTRIQGNVEISEFEISEEEGQLLRGTSKNIELPSVASWVSELQDITSSDLGIPQNISYILEYPKDIPSNIDSPEDSSRNSKFPAEEDILEPVDISFNLQCQEVVLNDSDLSQDDQKIFPLPEDILKNFEILEYISKLPDLSEEVLKTSGKEAVTGALKVMYK